MTPPFADKSTLLKVDNLRTHFFTHEGVVKAVDGVDFSVRKGEVFGLVGESGCGKSVTALSIMRLIGKPGRIVSGCIRFDGNHMLDLPESEMEHLRGSRISMIFQEPKSSLNPVFTVGAQVAEMFRTHRGETQAKALNNTLELLREVGIPDPGRRAQDYPHQLSGGQAQRVMIAMALALTPELLIADEPTTALDVTVQAQILDLIRNLCGRWNTAVILITHDLGVIAEMCDRVTVMYAGRIVEQARVRPLFAKPSHPYTQGSIQSIPILGRVKDRLGVIPGSMPNAIDLPLGCRFADRCQARQAYQLGICTEREPDLVPLEGDHSVRCWLYQDAEGHQGPARTERAVDGR